MSERRRVLGPRDLTLFTVSGIIVLDQLASSAAIGPSALGWWVVTLVFFSIPYAAITAELGAAWPSQGGLYVWIREAFGERWAARSVWYYWINLAIWVPSVAVLASSMMSQLFWPELSMFEKLVLAIIFIILIGTIGSLRTDVGKWVPNLGAILKVIVMLVIGGAGVYLFANGQSQTEFTPQTMSPSYEGAISFLPIIVFNLMGFELMSAAGGEIKNPRHSIPQAIFASVVVVGGLYIFSTFGMLAALPSEDIVLDTGIIEALKIAFAQLGNGGFFVSLLGAFVIITLVTNMITWAMGANRSIQTAAEDGVMPAVFAIEHRSFKTPIAANFLLAALSSVVIVIYSMMASSVEDLFWTLLAFSSVVFFIPYLFIFASFLYLRAKAGDRDRPFRVPGGWPVAILSAALCYFFVVQAIILFVYVPGSPVDWEYTLSIVVGVLIVIAIGERIIPSKCKLKD